MRYIQSTYRRSEFIGGLAPEVIKSALFLVLIQCADGVLTYLGLSFAGCHSMEGNAILRQCMDSAGIIPTLFAAKLTACAAVSMLCFASIKVPWVKFAIDGVSFVYLCAAIIPWTFLISSVLS